MGCSCDRPYPYFTADVEEFTALEDGHNVQYNLGCCYIAYKNILNLYNAAMGIIRGQKSRPSKKMKRLMDACEKTYKDFNRANFIIDEEEIRTGKAAWE